MNDYLLQSYIDHLSENDINDFALKQGVTLSSEELEVIYECLKKDWRTFYYGNPRQILEELKKKLSENTYAKIEALYIQAKNRFF